MHHSVGSVLFLLGFFFFISQGACDCASTAPGGNADIIGTAGGDANAVIVDATVPLDDAGDPIITDGSVVSYDDSGTLVFVDASTGISDAAGDSDTSPLVQPLPDFCAGSGAVVSFGEDNICSGDLATQTFRFGLCACDTFTTSAQLTVDSFDSSLGAYGDQTPGDDGNIGINNGPLNLSRKITIQGSGFIGGGGLRMASQSLISQNLSAYGDVTLTNGNASVGRNAFINGDLGTGMTIQGDLYQPVGSVNSGTVQGSVVNQPIPNTMPCPCGEDQLLDVAGLTAWAETHNDNATFAFDDAGSAIALDPTLYESGGPDVLRLPCGRFYLSSVNQSSGALDIIVTSRAVLFINGDLSTSRFSITVQDGGELDIFVAGDVSISAAADFGSAATPSLVRTYIGGNVALQASANFSGNIYAPHADINFGAAGEIYGSLFVNTATFGAAARIHFDSAIRHAADNCVDVTLPDGGMLVDSGSNPDSAVSDAALSDTTSTDLFTPPVDASMPDVVQPDAAEDNTCSGVCSFECGVEACIIEGAIGHCGACRNDLDCCAPMLCEPNSGVCYYPGG